MELKVGNVVFYDWVEKAEEAEIIKCYPKTDRYRIRVQGKEELEFNVKVSEVFRTENDLWQSKIDQIDGKIKALEEKREEYTGNIIESHILNE